MEELITKHKLTLTVDDFLLFKWKMKYPHGNISKVLSETLEKMIRNTPEECVL